MKNSVHRIGERRRTSRIRNNDGSANVKVRGKERRNVQFDLDPIEELEIVAIEARNAVAGDVN